MIFIEKSNKPAPVAVKNDSFIVLKAPKRGGAVAKTAISTRGVYFYILF